MSVPLPHPLGFCECRGRGLCHPTQTGKGSSAPSPTSCIWVCLGSSLPLCPASSPFIRCHGHSPCLEEKGLSQASGFQREGLGLCFFGCPLIYVHTYGGAQYPPWRPPRHGTPIHVGFQCPPIWLPTVPPAPLPAGPPRGSLWCPLPGPAPWPHRPLPRPRAGPQAELAGPRPRLSESSLRAALREDPGTGCSGPCRGSAGLGPRPLSRRVSALGPLPPQGPACVGLCPSPPRTRLPGRGVPRFPPHSRPARGLAQWPCRDSSSLPLPCATPRPPFGLVACTLENSRPLCSVGSPPPPGPQPTSSPTSWGRSQVGAAFSAISVVLW